jgi:hypothetical protein
MKNPPVFTQAQIEDLEEALQREKESWASHRIETMLSVTREGTHLSAKELAERHNIGYSTLFRWIRRFKKNGIGALLCRHYRRSTVGRNKATTLFCMRLFNSERIKAKYEMEEWIANCGDTKHLGIFANLG